MITDYTSSTVRIVVRVYFLVVLTLVAMIGDNCSLRKTKAGLAGGKKVPVTNMTGWIGGLIFFWNWLKLRSIPGGFRLGLLMGLTAVVTLSADLMVSYLVHSVRVITRCNFGTGMVLSPDGPFTSSYPAVNGRPYSVAMISQATSKQNGGLFGVFDKINTNPNFCAEEQDVLTGWSCNDYGQSISYGSTIPIVDIANDLVTRGLMFSNYGTEATQSPEENGQQPSAHLVIMGISDQSDGTFQVTFSVDQSINFTDTKIMQGYGCKINDSAANDILSSINTISVIQPWLPNLQGGCYDGAYSPPISNVSTFLEQFLNTMVMIQGGNNNLLQTPTGDPTQGCLTIKTYIHPAVLALVALAGCMFFYVTIYWIILFALLKKHSGLLSTALKCTPDGAVGWMIHAVRESRFSKAPGRHSTSQEDVAEPESGNGIGQAAPYLGNGYTGSRLPLLDYEPVRTHARDDDREGAKQDRLLDEPYELRAWTCRLESQGRLGPVVKLFKR